MIAQAISKVKAFTRINRNYVIFCMLIVMAFIALSVAMVAISSAAHDNIFAQNNSLNRPEAQANIKLYSTLPNKVKQKFYDKKIKIKLLWVDTSNLLPEADGYYLYDSKTKILTVNLFPTNMKTTNDKGVPYTGINYDILANYNAYNFLTAIASIYDNGGVYSSTKSFYNAFLASTNDAKGYMITLPPSKKYPGTTEIRSVINDIPYRYYRSSFAIYFLKSNLLSSEAPATYQYINESLR
jgi:hypothetical protein